MALREPPVEGQVLTSGAELDWAMAEKAAKAILKQCEDAFFAPPEATDLHWMRVGYVCKAMDALVDALRLRGGQRQMTHTLLCVVSQLEANDRADTYPVFKASVPSLKDLFRDGEDRVSLAEAVKRMLAIIEGA